jgi:hypothetical protein
VEADSIPPLGLEGWALEFRAKLVHACLTLIQAWIAAGQVPGKSRLGTFEGWAETMSGILENAGVPGFLENSDLLHVHADEEMQEWRAFLYEWWDEHKGAEVGTEELFDIANLHDLLLDVTEGGTERSRRTRFGKALSDKRDRIIGPFRIVHTGEDNHGRRQYRLERVEERPT